MAEFIQEINWTPLWISLKTGAVATTIAFFLGIWCARKIMKMKPVSRAVLDGVLTMPLVLPPTVAGFFFAGDFQPPAALRKIFAGKL